MHVWEMTLKEFLSKDCKIAGPTGASFEQFMALVSPPGWYEGKEVALESHPGFATAPLKRPEWEETPQYQMLLQKTDEGWKPVGMYIDDTIIVSECVGGQGLGTELALRCIPHRPVPERRTLSPAGLRTLTRAYYSGVERAITEGRDVQAHIREASKEWHATKEKKSSET